MALIQAELSGRIIGCCLKVHLAPARSCLKATSLQPALVVNFARRVLDIRRVVLTQ